MLKFKTNLQTEIETINREVGLIRGFYFNADPLEGRAVIYADTSSGPAYLAEHPLANGPGLPTEGDCQFLSGFCLALKHMYLGTDEERFGPRKG